MLEETLKNKKQRVSKMCQKQVQNQLRQREENEALDPRLNEACGQDIPLSLQGGV